MLTKKLLLYEKLKNDEIISLFDYLLSREEHIEDEVTVSELSDMGVRCASMLIEEGVKHGFAGNLWHDYLTYALVNDENALSLSAERKDGVEGTLSTLAIHDFDTVKRLYDVNLEDMDAYCKTECFALIKDFVPDNKAGKIFNERIRDRICDLAALLSRARDNVEFLNIMTEFYRDYGVGKYGLHKAFRVRHADDGSVFIDPIKKVKHIYLDDLVGYEAQKKKLIENTEAFIGGRRANNCLLYGDMGTGKSSCIKALINKYYDSGLRLIEVFKHQMRDLNDIVSQIKGRNYRFIIYMDDLSFEDHEVEYKYLKAVIEGGLEKQPENMLIYATSNRRHLIHEGFSDKLDRSDDDDIHASDTVQEKLSLSARFGVSIYFGRPDKKQYDNIVRVLAQRYGVKLSDEELLGIANRWELEHGGYSGRAAQQLIDYILGTGIGD